MSCWDLVKEIAIYTSGFYLIIFSGNEICRWVLETCNIKKDVPNSLVVSTTSGGAGRVIGALERSLIFLSILLRSWELIVVVVTLKTIARYQELDKQITAEYFLVGSLTSLLWTIICSGALLFYDYRFGFYLAAEIRRILK